MQRWEYMIRKTDLKALNQSSMLDLEQVRLTEYGEEGWEMVSAVPSQESLIIFLKRPVEVGGCLRRFVDVGVTENFSLQLWFLI